jgi:exopolyphosphatase/guanosine-5'-triphosphate,3'-diphosphate pyrophosphatase
MTKKVRTAVIDVGTLKNKFEVREFDKFLNSTLISRQKELTVLGRDLDKSDDFIIRKAIETTIVALNKFKKEMIKFKVDKYRVVTTETIRKAKNSKEVLNEILERTGLALEVLDHKEEAEIYFKSVSKDFPGQTIAVSDIGGGSVQVVIGKDKDIYETHLFKTGTYFMQENFSESHHPNSKELQNAMEYVAKEMKSLSESKYKPEVLIYGSTNIIDFMKAMGIDLSRRELGGEHPYWVDASALNPLYDKIVSLSYEDRMLMYPAEPYYMWSAENALINIFQICKYLNTYTIFPSNNNISSGILRELAL